jgi:hypothetical protein
MNNTIQTVHGLQHKPVTLTREPFLTDIQWETIVKTINSAEFDCLGGYYQEEVDFTPQINKGTTFLLWWDKDGNCRGTKVTPTGRIKELKA